MSLTDLAVAYARISDLYRRQLDLLASDEPDLDAIMALIVAVDDELARLPPSDRLPALDRGEAEQLAAAARAADALRAHAAARVAELRANLSLTAAHGERAASAVRAYDSAPDAATARFLDQKR